MLFLENIPDSVLQKMYYAMQVFSFPVLVCVAACLAPKYDMSRKKGALYALCVYLVLFGFMYLIPNISWALGLPDSINSSRCCLFVLIPTAIFARISKVPALRGGDFMIPSLFAARVSGKIGCAIVGCCHGFPCDWGIYSSVADARVFPLQFLEIAFCLIMVVGSILYSKRWHHNANGRVFGLAIAVFGIERYFIQFLTTDYQFGIGFNMQSVYAILMTLLGLFVLYWSGRKALKS